MHRKLGQRSLAEELVGATGQNQRLEKIDGLMDWGRIAKVVGDIHGASEGQPSYPPLMQVKALLLGQWYGLSDPMLEEALGDRLSFRRFVGLSLEDKTPDHVTLWRFRQELSKQDRDQALLAEVNRQLEERGLILKRGTLLDATVVQAQAATPSSKDRNVVSRSTVDPDAHWTHAKGGMRFGYKAHVSVDQDSNLIRRAKLTPANVAESLVADALICGDEQAVYADKAYENKHRRKRLRAQGVKDRILHRSHKNQAGLPYWQQRRNALIAPIRKRIERIFGTLKRSYGYVRVRYYRLHRNATQLCLLAVAYNLRRAAVLTG